MKTAALVQAGPDLHRAHALLMLLLGEAVPAVAEVKVLPVANRVRVARRNVDHVVPSRCRLILMG